MKSNEKVIWILEDDPAAKFVYQEALGIRYQTEFFDHLEDFEKGLRERAEGKKNFNLLIVDLKLKDKNFVSFVKKENPGLTKTISPYLVVSSLDDMDVLRWCFENGAVDYLTKPFRTNELIIKTERILGSASNILGAGVNDIHVDTTTLSVHFQGQGSLPLTLKEFQIFQALSRFDNFCSTRSEIVKKVWRDVKVTEKAFDVHLVNLRRKLLKVGIEIVHQSPDKYKILIAR